MRGSCTILTDISQERCTLMDVSIDTVETAPFEIEWEGEREKERERSYISPSHFIPSQRIIFDLTPSLLSLSSAAWFKKPWAGQIWIRFEANKTSWWIQKADKFKHRGKKLHFDWESYRKPPNLRDTECSCPYGPHLWGERIALSTFACTLSRISFLSSPNETWA